MGKEIYTLDGKKVNTAGVFTKIEGYLKNWKKFDNVTKFLSSMKTVIINVDCRTDQEKERLADYCAQYYFYAHITESVYIIKSMQDISEIRRELLDFISTKTTVFVIQINSAEYSWDNVICSDEWINKYL